MVNLDHLAARGLRAYELGRLRVAARVGLVLIPASAICLLEERGRPSCACAAVLLLALSVWLRWRNRRGIELASTGLVAGSIPLIAGLLLARAGVNCDDAASARLCTAVSLVAGIGSGVVIAAREARQRARLASWLTAIAIAGLAAGLGCLRLGIAGLAGVAGGMAAGAMPPLGSRAAELPAADRADPRP